MCEKWMKKCLVFTLILLQILPLSGCYDSKELDEKTFLTMIGLDVGKEHPLKLSLQFERLTEGDKSSQDKEKTKISTNIEVVSEEVDTIYTGEGLLTIATSRQFENSHIKMVVFSEELARSKKFEKYVASMIRNHSIRGITHIIIAKGKAEDFLKENQLMTSPSTSKAVEILMRQIDYNAYFPHIKLNEFYNRMKSTRRQAIVPIAGVNKQVSDGEKEEGKKKKTTEDASIQKNGEKQKSEDHSADDAAYKAGELPRSGGLAREIFGSAVFDGAKMVGELTGEETRILLMVRDEFKKSNFAIKDPLKKNNMLALTVERSRAPEFEVDTSGVRPVVHVKISLEGRFDAIQSGVDYERPQMKKLAEKAFEEDIKSHLDALIEKCQIEFKSDVFGFGRVAIKHFLIIEEWEKYNWLKAFTKAEVTSEVSFTIRRTGTLMKSEKTRSVEGKEKDEEEDE